MAGCLNYKHLSGGLVHSLLLSGSGKPSLTQYYGHSDSKEKSFGKPENTVTKAGNCLQKMGPWHVC